MSKNEHEYKKREIREALITTISANYYGSFFEAEQKLESIERTVKNMSFEKAKKEDGYVYTEGLGGCVWLMQQIEKLEEQEPTFKFSKSLEDMQVEHSYTQGETQLHLLMDELQANYDEVLERKRKEKLAKERKERREHQTENKQNLRNFLKRPKGPGR